MDLSVLSIEDLRALKAGDLSKMSTEGLKALRGDTQPAQEQTPPQEETGFPGASIIEPALSVASGIPATIAGGLAGLGQMVNPFAEEGSAARAVEGVTEALTYQPKTTEGQGGLQTLGENLKPLTDAVEAVESASGDTVAEKFGPTAGAIAKTLPAAVLSALPVRLPKGGQPKISPQRGREIDQVIKAGEVNKVDVMTSDIFPPKSIFAKLSRQFSERIPVLGTGGKRASQQDQRIAAIDRLDQETPQIEPADIFASLQKSANKFKNAAGERLNTIKDQMVPLGVVPVDNTIARIDQAIDILKRPGTIPNDDLISSLNMLKDTAVEAGGDFDLLRKFRTGARNIAEKVDPNGKTQLRGQDKALMDSVVSSVTKDLDAFVLANSDPRTFGRYKKADVAYRAEARKLTKSRLKNVLDIGDVKPERINDLLFSSAPSEVKMLFNSLDKSGRQNARLALYRRALDTATKGDNISTAKFISALDKMSDNFGVFFRGADRAEMMGLKKLLETTRHADQASVVTNTGQALQLPATTATLGGAAIGNPQALASLLTAGTVGAIARTIESAGVRDALIRLGKAPRRSKTELDLLRTTPLLLERGLQGLSQEQEVENTP